MAESSSTPRKEYQFARPYRNWATIVQKQELLSKQTTQQRTILYTIMHAKKITFFFYTGFHWIRNRAKKGQFGVYWKPGPNNKSDYVTKHHPPAVHREMRPTYIYIPSYPTSSPRGFVNPGIPTPVEPPLTDIPLTVKPPLNRNS